MPLILDVSAVISLAFPDEDPVYAKSVFRAVATDQAFVPTLFWFEVRNALLMGERRGRSTAQQTALFLDDLALVPIEVDYEPREAVVLSLAREQTLTVYDAAYLELAQRRQCPLATQDAALIKAAKAVGVPIWQA